MKPTARLRSFLAALGTAALALSHAQAAIIYWDGTSASWNTVTNWTTAAGAATPDPGAIPGASDDTIFNRTGQNGNINIALDADQSAQSLTFNSTGTTTIRGNTSGTTARQLTIGTGGITVNSGAGASSFGGSVGVVNIVLSGSQTWTNNSVNALNVGTGYVSSATDANVALGVNNLTIDGSGRTNIGVSNQSEAVLTGSGALIKNGTGVLQLGGNNSAGFSGNVTINGGVVNYGDVPTALGAGNNIEITGGILESRWSTGMTRSQGAGVNQIRITSGISGLSGGGSVSGAVTHNIGAITWGSATFNPTQFVLQSANAGTGTTTLSSAINLNGDGGTPDINGVVWRTIRSDQTNFAGFGQFSGNITNTPGATNAAGLIKTGVGLHILSGTNSYNGGTQVNQGTLRFAAKAAMSSSGAVTVNDGAILGINLGTAATVWSNGTSGVGTLGGLLTGDGGQTASQVTYNGNVGLNLEVVADVAYGGNIANVGTTLALHKTGASKLTLSGNNSYTGSTTLWGGTITANSATALGNGGDITFKGGTLQFTANSLSTSWGSRIKNSTSVITLDTNSQNVTLTGNIDNTNTAGLTKNGAGTLTLSGTNAYSGTTTINTGSLVIDGGTTSSGAVTFTAANTSMSIINGGKLNSTGNSDVGNSSVSNVSVTVTGGNGVISKWDLGNSLLGVYGFSPVRDNKDLTIDGAGFADSAVVTNISNLEWGRSTSNSDILVTNGGRLGVNNDVLIGSTYYGTTGINNTITIQGGSANSIMTVGRDFVIGHGDRPGASSNTTTVGAGGQLTITRDIYVGQMNSSQNTDTYSTNNKLVVTGGGTASAAILTVGFSNIASRTANANIVEVSNGGDLYTTGVSYIGRALVGGAQSNNNTATVTGTGSSWDAGNQTVYVGHTVSGATSNNNILTVASGGALTNVSSLIVGFGSGTKTGNQVVLNNGTITATTVTVNAGNSMSGSGTITGNVTVNGTLTPGNSIGTLAVTGDLNISGLAGGTGGLNFELGTIASSDKITVGGGLNIGSGTLNFADFVFTDVGGLQNGTYVLISGATSLTGTLDSTPGSLTGTIGAGPATGTLQFTGNNLELLVSGVGASTPYEDWATDKGLTGAPGFENGKGADPDGDGRNNLAEFAFDGDPLSAANDGKIVGKVATVGGNQQMTLTLPVRTGASFSADSGDLLSAQIDGIYYRIEGTVDLTTFNKSIAEVTPAITAGLPSPLSTGWEYRTFTFASPDTVPTVSKAFLRAKVSEAP